MQATFHFYICPSRGNVIILLKRHNKDITRSHIQAKNLGLANNKIRNVLGRYSKKSSSVRKSLNQSATHTTHTITITMHL